VWPTFMPHLVLQLRVFCLGKAFIAKTMAIRGRALLELAEKLLQQCCEQFDEKRFCVGTEHDAFDRDQANEIDDSINR
jgi:hypothetical protein